MRNEASGSAGYNARARRRITIIVVAMLLAVLISQAASTRWSYAFFAGPALPGAAARPSTKVCGTERWAVKIGTDADARLVALHPVRETSVTQLTSLHPPRTLPSRRRIKPVETTIWGVSAWLLDFRQEADKDYHLVVGDGHGHTMIAEIPSPSCVPSTSPLAPGIRGARASFDRRFHVTKRWRTTHTLLHLTGVGFFDAVHGQKGVARNGVELHPVLSVSVASPTATPAPTEGAVEIPTEIASPTPEAPAEPTATEVPTDTSTPVPVATTTPLLTPTPTDTQVPVVYPTSRPAQTIQVTAWVSNPSPPRYSHVTVYGRITDGGVGVAGVPMDTAWHYKTTTSYCSGTSNGSGTASCERYISSATAGYTVIIDVTFTYNGQRYSTETSFTPQ